MEKESKIYIAGHKGLVGSAIERVLKKEGYENILGKTHAELDLTEQSKVNEFFEVNRPEYVFWLLQRWAEFTLIILTQPNSFFLIFRFKIML
ncbi:RmlD substrate binding domain protein [Leptospira interrogans serovar Pyrogenes str. 200701872]|uniref:RmlD substrate binding domain protein n=1 Tax=Leptospira interrogans serovar Pyrogenes str. 200701872 TaxID=1193029 RepID=M6ZQ76_LEPIR|nr:RmlD substrate binding domain protein [Leptospira interrogans serovar Pyrogenes str. 200701872]